MLNLLESNKRKILPIPSPSSALEPFVVMSTWCSFTSASTKSSPPVPLGEETGLNKFCHVCGSLVAESNSSLSQHEWLMPSLEKPQTIPTVLMLFNVSSEASSFSAAVVVVVVAAACPIVSLCLFEVGWFFWSANIRFDFTSQILFSGLYSIAQSCTPHTEMHEATTR